MKKINYNVSGIDLSSEEMFAAIVDKGVRKFTTLTRGLEEASCYLKEEGIEKIVMKPLVYIGFLFMSILRKQVSMYAWSMGHTLKMSPDAKPMYLIRNGSVCPNRLSLGPS